MGGNTGSIDDSLIAAWISNETGEIEFYRRLTVTFLVLGCLLIGVHLTIKGVNWDDIKTLGVHWIGIAIAGVSPIPTLLGAGRKNKVATLKHMQAMAMKMKQAGQVPDTDIEFVLKTYQGYYSKTLEAA